MDPHTESSHVWCSKRDVKSYYNSSASIFARGKGMLLTAYLAMARQSSSAFCSPRIGNDSSLDWLHLGWLCFTYCMTTQTHKFKGKGKGGGGDLSKSLPRGGGGDDSSIDGGGGEEKRNGYLRKGALRQKEQERPRSARLISGCTEPAGSAKAAAAAAPPVGVMLLLPPPVPPSLSAIMAPACLTTFPAGGGACWASQAGTAKGAAAALGRSLFTSSRVCSSAARSALPLRGPLPRGGGGALQLLPMRIRPDSLWLACLLTSGSSGHRCQREAEERGGFFHVNKCVRVRVRGGGGLQKTFSSLL